MMTPEERRRARIWQKYGLTEEGYSLMAASQQGRCLICRDDSSELVIDHCHATGEVRGLLCHRCNVALGWMNDSPTNLVRAARYLKRFAA